MKRDSSGAHPSTDQPEMKQFKVESASAWQLIQRKSDGQGNGRFAALLRRTAGVDDAAAGVSDSSAQNGANRDNIRQAPV
jgi:hypothetical protein